MFPWNEDAQPLSSAALELWNTYGVTALDKTFVIILIVGLTWLALKVRTMVISKIFRLTRLEEKQRNTLESLLLSFTKYVFVIIAFLMCLSNVGVEVGPIIAGAGVIGLAVGFGAQTLVKDLITGFFIIFEDQFSVGDYVTINNGEINGTVVSVGLRATKIRTWAQHVVVIQNSEIRISQNYNREKMRAIVNVSVPYETDPADVEGAVHAVSEHMVDTMKHLFLLDEKGEPIEPPQLYGITDVENNALGAKYTVVALVKDVHYFTACKVMRQFIVEQLKAGGIHISYPRRVERKDVEMFYQTR
ncbi:mechanosensitive ion channel family protein [Paenibacillus turpanensis]|uniref:mechanosensitive ion channel family protein n=1 Tax=Paenibacillus turpanensis TaxID=2689078 RepID=UPI00140A95E9|nr:mechanosensitive ion channel family protein [Paenibacillus turpanensis]